MWHYQDAIEIQRLKPIQKIQEFEGKIIVIVFTYYSPSCLGLETAKVPFGLPVLIAKAQNSQKRLRNQAICCKILRDVVG